MNIRQLCMLCLYLALIPYAQAEVPTPFVHQISGEVRTGARWNHSLRASHLGYTVTTDLLVSGWRLTAGVANQGMLSSEAGADWYDTRFVATVGTRLRSGTIGASAVSNGDDSRLTVDLSHRPSKKVLVTASGYVSTITSERFGVEATAMWQLDKAFVWQLQSNYVHRLVFNWVESELVLQQGLQYHPPHTPWWIALDHQKNFSGQGGNRLLARIEWRF